jgi:FlaG/FlaF family flagellin (archaellin)
MAYINKLVSVIFTILVIAISPALAAAPASFAGEWADKNYLKGKGVFQLSLEQKDSDVSVFFSAAHNDGSGAAPEANGKGKATGKGMVEFTWEDSFKNSGTGTIKRAGNEVVVSLKPTHVIDSRCLEFYGDNIRLKPAGKK